MVLDQNKKRSLTQYQAKRTQHLPPKSERVSCEGKVPDSPASAPVRILTLNDSHAYDLFAVSLFHHATGVGMSRKCICIAFVVWVVVGAGLFYAMIP